MSTVRIKSITQNSFYNDVSGAVELSSSLRVGWIDDEDQEGAALLAFADYAGLETEWNLGQGTAFTVLDAALDTWLTTGYSTTDDATSTEIGTGRKGYVGTSP